MQKTINTSGKRKQSIARATLKPGKGYVRINHQLLDTFQPEIARMRITEPLLLADTYAKQVNIEVNVKGGGWAGQADAARLAIAKALVEFSKSKQLKQTFLEYDRNLLIADKRRGESSKPNDSKPRSARQKSYR